jgi:hypothetical protein
LGVAAYVAKRRRVDVGHCAQQTALHKWVLLGRTNQQVRTVHALSSFGRDRASPLTPTHANLCEWTCGGCVWIWASSLLAGGSECPQFCGWGIAFGAGHSSPSGLLLLQSLCVTQGKSWLHCRPGARVTTLNHCVQTRDTQTLSHSLQRLS